MPKKPKSPPHSIEELLKNGSSKRNASMQEAQNSRTRPPQPFPIVLTGNDPSRSISIKEIDPHAPRPPTKPETQRVLDDHHEQLAGKLQLLLGAIPSTATADAIGGKRIMEVIIDGDLQKARDGIGFRATSRLNGKITNNARLISVENIKKTANFAAMWNIASVVVAQAHLASINQKLSDIKRGVDHLISIINQKRVSKIKGTIKHLHQEFDIICNGNGMSDLSTHLTAYDREMCIVHEDILEEIRSTAKKRILNQDTFGTKSLYDDGIQKYTRIAELLCELELCAQARSMICFLQAICISDAPQTEARFNFIAQSLAPLSEIRNEIHTAAKIEASTLKSIWNTGSTLDQRRSRLLSEAQHSQVEMSSIRIRHDERSSRLLAKLSTPTRFIIEMSGDRITKIESPDI